MRQLPSKINIGDNWSHQLALIWCYCCDNKHLRTLISLFMQHSNVLAASEAQRALTGRTLEAYLGYLPSVTVLLWTLHSSLAVEGIFHWAKGDKGKHLPRCGCLWCGGIMWGHKRCPGWWPQGRTVLGSLPSPWHTCFKVVAHHLCLPGCPGLPPVSLWEVFEVLHTKCELIKVLWAGLLTCPGPTG